MRIRPSLAALSLLAAACGSSSTTETGSIHCSTDAECGGVGACISGLCPGGAALTASALTSTLLISTTAPAYGTSGLPLPAGLSSGNKATILVTLKTSAGVAVGAGQSVTLSSDGSNNSMWPSGGSVVSNNAVGSTNGSGVAIFYMTSTTAETKNLTATITTAPGFTLTGTQLFMTAAGVSLGNSSFTASPVSPAAVAANGTSTSTLTTTVHDAYGNPIAGHLVTYACTSGCTSLVYSPAASGNTNAAGVYTATIASTTVENAAMKSTIQGVSALPPNYVQFVATSPATPLLTESTGTVLANGTATSTLTGTVTDQFGNPLSGQTITFNNLGAVGSLSATSCTTNASGSCSVTISSHYVLGTTSITATANSLTSGSVSVTFTGSNTPSQTLSTITVSPSSVPADGVTTMTVTLTVLDTTGQPISGAAVCINGSGGQVTLTTICGTTNSSGQFSATDASNLAQTVQFTSASTAYLPVSGTFSATPPLPLTAPPGVSATGVCGGGSVNISWGAIATADFYHVLRSTSPTGPWTLIYSPRVTSQVDSTIAAGTTYYYEVYASNSLGNGPASAPVAVVCGPPPAPTNVAVSGGCSTGSPVSVSWTASPTATQYQIYRSPTFTPQIGSVNSPATSYSDTTAAASTSYSYEVTASNTYGTSPVSAQATLTCAPPSGYCGGSGTSADPYQICNEAAFIYMGTSGDANTTGIYFKQMNALTLSSAWYPFELSGNYDGNEQTITYSLSPTQAQFDACAGLGNYQGYPAPSHNMYCDNLGLFLATYAGASITNLKVSGATIVGGGTNSGLLIGAVQGATTITNVQVIGGSVTGYFAVGGMIGVVYSGGNATYSKVSVTGTSVISSATGGDWAYNDMGGLIGQMQGYGGSLYIQDCAASGSLHSLNGAISSPSGGGIGGLIGDTVQTFLTRCVSTVTFSAPNDAASDFGLTGQDDGLGGASSSYWANDVSSASGFTSGDSSIGDPTSTLESSSSIYGGWDFTTPIWNAPVSGSSAPTLHF